MNLDWFREWLLEDPETRAPLTLAALGILLVLPLIAFAVYLWRMAARVTSERTFPPSGYRVIGKPTTITGDAALTYARVARAMAVFLIVMSGLLVFQLWRFGAVLSPSRTFIE